ncbi:hypothetical protein EG329_000921 [Mollisiaceae sp. DMI_Dod_QoI]|nr:hypothetical protein EG329_000921 [Helotiales sp. DMI_Dod_QoI]
MKDIGGQSPADEPRHTVQPEDRNDMLTNSPNKKSHNLQDFYPDKRKSIISTFSWTPLPTELWRTVFKQINNFDSFVAQQNVAAHGDITVQKDVAIKRDFTAISLVSRRLHRIVEPYLYNRFTWIPAVNILNPPLDLLEERDVKQITKSRRKKRAHFPYKSGPPPYLLLRTVLNRPDLVRHFKSVKILAASPESGLFWDMFEAREGPGYSSVTSITFSMDKDEDGDSYTWLEDHHGEDAYDVDTQVAKILKFPQLNSLELHFCSPDPTWPSALPLAPNLRKLTLRFGSLRENMLGQLVASTPFLEELDCDLVYDRFLGQYMDCSKLNKLLSVVKDTLTRLAINLEILWAAETEDGNGFWDVLDTMGSMKHFTKLRYLDMPLISLVPQEGPRGINILATALPDSLEIFKACRSPGSPDLSTRLRSEEVTDLYLRKNDRLKERDLQKVVYGSTSYLNDW